MFTVIDLVHMPCSIIKTRLNDLFFFLIMYIIRHVQISERGSNTLMPLIFEQLGYIVLDEVYMHSAEAVVNERRRVDPSSSSLSSYILRLLLFILCVSIAVIS